jgi:hypothetical protein
MEVNGCLWKQTIAMGVIGCYGMLMVAMENHYFLFEVTVCYVSQKLL